MAIRRVRFFVSDQVQDVGCRGFIISEMMFAGFEKGNAINHSDGRVEVRIEGEEGRIKEFVEELRRKLEAKYGSNSNPKVEVSGTESFEGTELRKLTEVSQAHLLTQFDKGVDVMKDIRSNLENLNKNVDNLNKKNDDNFSTLPKKIAEELDGKFNELPKKIAEELDSKFTSLPKQIAAELDVKFDELPKNIAKELDSRFDSLPKKMAVELKAVLRS